MSGLAQYGCVGKQNISVSQIWLSYYYKYDELFDQFYDYHKNAFPKSGSVLSKNHN